MNKIAKKKRLANTRLFSCRRVDCKNNLANTPVLEANCNLKYIDLDQDGQCEHYEPKGHQVSWIKFIKEAE